jgi:C_GCAxxG_C_C family probable redox protein
VACLPALIAFCSFADSPHKSSDAVQRAQSGCGSDRLQEEAMEDSTQNAMTRTEAARNYFTEGYNCSQAVLLAFSDLLPVQPEFLARMASSFGGGMGRLREVCGAVSGMFLAAGLLYGYDSPEAGAPKAEHYRRIQELAAEFESINGSIVCRELLNLNQKKDPPCPEDRTVEYYRRRPCRELVGIAAGILENYIRTHPECQTACGTVQQTDPQTDK